jgi:hypothetical protein
MTKSKNSKRKYVAVAAPSTSVKMTTVPTASSDTRSDKKVKSEQKTSRLDRVSQVVALNNMQGTINRLTDVFKKSMVPPQEAAVGRRGDALQQLQERDDGFTREEKITLIHIFKKRPDYIDTHLALIKDDIRQGWMWSLLTMAAVGVST